MRLSDSSHRARPWAVHAIAGDFALLDVWGVDLRGSADDFARFLDLHERGMADGSPVDHPIASSLFRIRLWLGERFGWDGGPKLPIPGCTEVSVRARLDESPTTDADTGSDFDRVYARADEALYEISNQTVHALLHFGWVPDGDEHTLEMAVYAKPRGAFGRAYMAAIGPFRHLVVYPALLRSMRRRWLDR